MRSLTFLVFVIITFLCWGVYGPVLHIGQAEMGADGKLSSLRPFICVGIAYFLIAVVFPLFVLMTKGESGGWSTGGFFWSFVAGAVGAIGALGIILAFKFKGDPVYVMPLVFGCAPVVNTLVTMLMSRTIKNASLLFYVSVLIVAIGAAGVLMFKPTKPKEHTNTIDQTAMATLVSYQEQQEPTGETSAETTKQQPESPVADSTKKNSGSSTNVLIVALCIAGTALCWGAYGPVLHKGQAKMGGSRLRPFLCVGLAYFAIAVVVPFMLLPYFPEPGGWTNYTGMGWSLLAGAAGAVGALGIIYAFNFGGKPLYVMPLVFGFAPVVNTITETVYKGLYANIEYQFWISLMLVILGAVMVLISAPRAKPAPKQPPEPAITQ